MPVTSRPYAGEEDYAQMRALLTTIYTEGGPPVYGSVGDLEWWRATDEDPAAVQRAQLWLDGQGKLLGFVWPSEGQIELLIHPHWRELEDDLLAWAEQQRWATRPLGSQYIPLTAWAYEQDAARNAILQSRGYERTDSFVVYRLRQLIKPLPEPSLPPGYQLRQIEGEADLERRVAVHRNAFAPSRLTVANHRAVIRSPTYRPELDLVAVAPDNSFAAFGLVWFDAINRLGVFEPVGCHCAHRRRGLARAILWEGMQRVQSLGARVASVNGLSDAAAATRLYESVGFQVVDHNHGWQKVLISTANWQDASRD